MPGNVDGWGCAVTVDYLLELLPTFVKWVEFLIVGGRDPKAELEAMMATADNAADIAEREKFGGGSP